MNDLNSMKAHLHRRYQRARRFFAARAPLFVLPLVVMAAILQVHLGALLCCSTLAVVVIAWGLYQGAPYIRASVVGAVVGTVPALVALVAMPLMSAVSEIFCQTFCISFSSIGAFLVIVFGARGLQWKGVFFAAVVALTMAPLGCAAMTLGASMGLLAGALLALPIPMWIWKAPAVSS